MAHLLFKPLLKASITSSSILSGNTIPVSYPFPGFPLLSTCNRSPSKHLDSHRLTTISGCLFSLSYVSVAAILSAPGVADVHMLSMWRTVFVRGFHLCPSQAILSGILCFVNALLTYCLEQDSSSRVYSLLIAGAFMIGIVPFTLSMIVPLEEIMLAKETKLSKAQQQAAENGKGINGRAEGLGGEGSAAETRRLLKRWAMLNYGRTILPVVGVLVAWSIW